MTKTLVIAEKPSVGRDLASALPGKFAKHEGYLESDDSVITWAVGHLVELVDPDEYDPKLKKWRMADLPIVPEHFKLRPRDAKAKKQLAVIHKLIKRDDVGGIVNACDAGREGELIFAYTVETAKTDKHVERLWLNSMTKKAIVDAFTKLRDGEEMRLLEAAARSRSEADWLVGMNATRAASIRLRAAFDGAVSLGRVQTPTLALVARREEEIRAFKPEPYWLVEAKFEAEGRAPLHRPLPRRQAAAEGGGRGEDRRRRARGQPGEITKVERKEERQKPELLYDLTSLQRHANTLYGFSARRTLRRGAEAVRGQEGDHVPAHELALPVGRPRRGDPPDRRARRPEPVVRQGGRVRRRARSSSRSRGSSTTRRSPTTTRSSRRAPSTTSTSSATTRSGSTTSSSSASSRRSSPRRSSSARASRRPSWSTSSARAAASSSRPGGVRSTARRRRARAPRRTTPAATSCCRASSKGEAVQTLSVESLAKETQPPRRFTEASLLAAMETAGKDIEDADLREAMKESGIGTPATRAAIIERLLSVGYIEREGRALHATEKGVQVIRLLGEHPLTSPELTGSWEHRLGLIEQGEDSRPAFMADIVKFTTETVAELDKLKEVKIERANLGPCPVCGRDVIENRKGYSCWSKDDPGCGFVIWKQKAGKTLPVQVVKELMANGRSDEAGDRLSRPLGPELQREAEARPERGRQVAGRVRRGVGAPAAARSGRGDGRARRRRRGRGITQA